MLEIHASKLDLYVDCPRNAAASMCPEKLIAAGYEVKVLPKYVTPTIGSAIHKGVEVYHSFKLSKNNPPDPGTIIEDARQEAHKLLEAHFQKHPETLFTKAFPDTETISTHIREYLTYYYDQVLPKRPVKLIEHHLDIPLTSNAKIVSTIDLYTTDDNLHDLKTGAKITPAYYQLGVYVFGLRHEGHLVNAAILDYLIRDKDGNVQLKEIQYDANACQDLAQYALSRLIKDWEEFDRTGDINVFTANPRSPMCNHVMCPIFNVKASCPVGY